MKTVGFGVLGALFAISSAHAAGPGSTITFQGEVFVTAASGCPASTAAVGDFYRIIYRHKVASSDPGDAIAFVASRAIYRILSTGASGSLSGSTTTSNADIDGHADLNTNVSGTANLNIVASGGGDVNVVNNIKLGGSLNDFFLTSGCTVTLRATLTKRVDAL